MDLPTAMVTRALAAPAVATIAADRVAWVTRPRAEGYPALVMSQVSEDRPQHLDGFDAMRSARVQMEAMSTDYIEARELLEAAIDALIGEADVAAVPPDTGTAMFWQGDLAGIRDTSEQVDGVGEVHRPIADMIIRYGIES